MQEETYLTEIKIYIRSIFRKTNYFCFNCEIFEIILVCRFFCKKQNVTLEKLPIFRFHVNIKFDIF